MSSGGRSAGVVDAAGWARAWLARRDPPPDVVLTSGLGPHLSELTSPSSAPSVRLAVSLLAEGCEQVVEPRLLASAATDYVAAVARRAIALGLEVHKAIPPHELVADGPERTDLERQIERWRLAAAVEQGTLTRLGPMWSHNLERNLPRIVEGESVSALTGAMAGKRVVVAGAGPSLEEVLPWLARERSRSAVVAASSALGPLIRHGIVPDAAVVIEARDCTRHFADVPQEALRKIVLLCESVSSPAHFELPFARVIHFHGALGRWLVPWSGRGSSLPTGGNVGTTALVIAWLLGGDPIGIAGLDFAMDEGRYYTPGSGSTRDDRGDRERFETVGWDGESLFATAELECYREQTEVTLRAIRARDDRTRFVALSRRGARIAGVEAPPDEPSMPLAAPFSTAIHPSRGAEGRAVPAALRISSVLEEVERTVHAIERLGDDERGAATALAAMHPSDSLVMGLLAPRLIGSRREGAYGLEHERQAATAAARELRRLARLFESHAASGLTVSGARSDGAPVPPKR